MKNVLPEGRAKVFFRCDKCYAMFASYDGTGLCDCLGAPLPHPPGWVVDMILRSDGTPVILRWICGECEIERWAKSLGR